MKKVGIIIIASIYLISGCQEKTEHHKETKVETQKKSKKETINKKKKEELKRNELMDKMGFEHFKITDFNVRVLNRHKCEYKIDYLIDSELYDYLNKEKPTYYFAVHYPENIVKRIRKYETHDVKGEIHKDGRLSGTVTIIDRWHKDFEAKKMSKETVDLQLYIKDKSKSEFYVIHDLNLYKKGDLPN